MCFEVVLNKDGMIFSILFPREDNRIPWNETGAEYIVESCDIGYGDKEVCCYDYYFVS